MKRTVIRMLHEAAVKYARVPYLLRKGDGGYEPTTFRETEEQATAFAAALLKRGFRKGQTVAILSEGSPQWVIGELGLLLAGCIAVPLSIRLLPEEIAFRLNHAGCRAILVSRNYLDRAASVLERLESRPFTLVDLDEGIAAGGGRGRAPALPPGCDLLGFTALVGEGREYLPEAAARLREIEAGVEEEDVVTISYTSGTTGNPKGIMLTHRNYFVNSTDSVVMHEVPEGYSMLVILPLDHSFAHTVGMYCGLQRGLSLYFVDARGGPMGILRNIPQNLKEAEPVFLLTVPALSGNFMKKIQAGVEEKGGLASALFRLGLKAGSRVRGDCWDRPAAADAGALVPALEAGGRAGLPQGPLHLRPPHPLLRRRRGAAGRAPAGVLHRHRRHRPTRATGRPRPRRSSPPTPRGRSSWAPPAGRPPRSGCASGASTAARRPPGSWARSWWPARA